MKSVCKRFRGRNQIKGGRICNPAKTLYSKIMYKYAQINEMRTFSYLKDSNKGKLCTILTVKHDFWLNGTSFPHSDRAGALRTRKIGK